MDPIQAAIKTQPQQQDGDSELEDEGDGSTWRDLHNLFDAAVRDKAETASQKLRASMHSLQVQNEILHAENEELWSALNAKKKQEKKNNTLDLQQRQEYHGGAVFWSPRKIREARAREAVEQREDEAEQHRKKEARDLRAEATRQKKQQAEEAKVARQQAKEDRECKARAEALAAERALKKQQRDSATAQNSHDRANKRKRTASHKAGQDPTKRRRVVAASSGADAGPPPASPPPKISARGRQIKTPARFK